MAITQVYINETGSTTIDLMHASQRPDPVPVPLPTLATGSFRADDVQVRQRPSGAVVHLGEQVPTVGSQNGVAALSKGCLSAGRAAK